MAIDDPENDAFDPATEQSTVRQLAIKQESDLRIARQLIENRRGAYIRVFVAGTPSARDREIVLADLHMFCRFNDTAFHIDERTHCLLTGRQEVTLRIDDFTRLGVDALVNKYTGRKGTD